MVQAINQRFNIPEKDWSTLPILLARLEARDVAPDYFAGELADELKLDRDKALNISAEVKRNILTPLKKEFSDFGIDISLLDTFKIPAIKGLSQSVVTAKPDAPKIIQDVSMAPPKPTQTLPVTGWSQMKPPAPIPPTSSTPPRPTATPAPTFTLPAVSVPATNPTPTPHPEPAPVILHEDTTFKAAQKNAGFTLTRPGGGADMHMGSGSGVPTPPKPAVLEFGGVSAKPPAAQTSAIHYTDFKPPLAGAPTANTGPRNVVQIGSTPTPPTPTQNFVPIPKPPSSPQPPQPVAPSQNAKPIVKDFL